MMTEFGATNRRRPTSTTMVARADRYMVPWLEWAYCGCDDPTTSRARQRQAIVIDPSKPPAGSNLVEPTLHALVEPYPQVIAGTPQSWGFDAVDGHVQARVLDRARRRRRRVRGPAAVTEIATPPLVYRGGYAAPRRAAAIVSPRVHRAALRRARASETSR